MSENKYRDYLSDDKSFYNQYLSEGDGPIEGSSSFGNLITKGAAVVGLAAGTAYAYKRGAFRKPMESMIEQLGKHRQGELAASTMAFDRWTKDAAWQKAKETKGIYNRFKERGKIVKDLPNHIKGANAEYKNRYNAHVARNKDNPLTMDNELDITDFIKQYQTTLRGIDKDGKKKAKAGEDITNHMKYRNVTKSEMDKKFDDLLTFSEKNQKKMMERNGYRQAKVSEVWEFLPKQEQKTINTFKSTHQGKSNVMDKVADKNIFVKEGKDGLQFSDLRDFRKSVASVSDSLAQDFSIPFIKINPMRMFYLNEFTKNKNPIVFANMSGSQVQPFLNKGTPQGSMNTFIDGRMHSFDEANNTLVRSNKRGYLVDASNDGQGSFFARNTATMTNQFKDKVEYTKSPGSFKIGDKEYGFRRNVWEPIAGDLLDFGRQTRKVEADMETGNPSSYLAPIARALYEGKGKWKGLKTYDKEVVHEPLFGEGAEHLFIPRFKTLKEMNEEGKGVKEFTKQFYAGRKNQDDVTTASFFAYTAAERLNSTIAQLGLGLSANNLGSPQQILAQLTLRRALPVVGAIEGVKLSNHVYEQLTGDEYEDQIADAFVNTQIGLGAVKDNLGITDLSKTATQLMPGIEFLSELPVPVLTTEGMTPIKLRDIFQLDKTQEEIEEYYESGEEEVRKGRYWEFGKTALTGGKVDYYSPNWYKRITSDWQYTDTLWGSKDEYWAYHPVFPVLDPYYWDKKHSEDRPYPVTGGIPLIEEMPLIGPALQATIGQVLKPTLSMKDGWGEKEEYDNSIGQQLLEAVSFSQEQTAPKVAGLDLSSTPNVGIEPTDLSIYRSSPSPLGVAEDILGTVGTKPISYITASGNVNIMQANELTSSESINKALSGGGARKTGMLEAERMSNNFYEGLPDQDLINAASVNMAMADMYSKASELGGFYGWVSGMVTTNDNAKYTPKIESSSRAYGMNQAFWDSDYGNMGGDAMEIMRRFIPNDNQKNYYNPIKNTMPSWLPGEEYFTDFQHGDPYSKVKRGEMRLPGSSYELLYGIDSKELENYKINSSMLGEDSKTMIQSMFNDIPDTSDKAFVRSQRSYFREAGVLRDNDMEKYKGLQENIDGMFDMYADRGSLLRWANSQNLEVIYSQMSEFNPESPYQDETRLTYDQINNLALNDEKIVVNFNNQINPDDVLKEMEEVNYYARNAQTSMGAIIEYGEEDETPRLRIFDYSDRLYEQTMQKVDVSKAAVNQMVKDGAISRFELYKPLDKYRILSDIAPYSDEYRNLKAQMSSMNLSPEEQKELQEINSQVSTRKEAIRTYDYRFKTADVKTEKVTVTKIIDNNKFLTKEYGDNPIKFAGVYIPTGEDEAGTEASNLIQSELKPGSTIRISVTADEDNLINNDTYRTIDAVVRTSKIGNLNKELIDRGLAKENEDDYSAAAVNARFSSNQIALGSAWESFAHLDTPFHTKLLAGASPLEYYERRELFGK